MEKYYNSIQDIHNEPVVPLYELIYRALRKDIIKGVYPAGVRLTEKELSEEAGVSRTPIREALKKLASDGLVDFNPQKGALVTSIGMDEIKVLWRMRAFIQGLAAEIAASKAKPKDINNLRKIIDKMENETKDNSSSVFNRTSNAFDKELLKIANVKQLSRVGDMIASLAWEIMAYVNQNTDVREKKVYCVHRDILKAIETGDGPKARKLAEDHISSWGPMFIEAYQKLYAQNSNGGKTDK